MVNPPSNVFCTPPRASAQSSAKKIENPVTAALNEALPGIDVERLFHSLDVVFGNRNYTLVGSASMHLHAIALPNATVTLPRANDLDLVIESNDINKLDFVTKDELNKLCLRCDDQKKHVLYYKHGNNLELKIDLIKSDNPLFKKYNDVIQIGGFSVRTLANSMASYSARARDADFITSHGGKDAAKAAVQPWFSYFDKFSLDAPPPQETGLAVVLPPQLKRKFPEVIADPAAGEQKASLQPRKSAKGNFKLDF